MRCRLITFFQKLRESGARSAIGESWANGCGQKIGRVRYEMTGCEMWTEDSVFHSGTAPKWQMQTTRPKPRRQKPIKTSTQRGVGSASKSQRNVAVVTLNSRHEELDKDTISEQELYSELLRDGIPEFDWKGEVTRQDIGTVVSHTDALDIDQLVEQSVRELANADDISDELDSLADNLGHMASGVRRIKDTFERLKAHRFVECDDDEEVSNRYRPADQPSIKSA